PALPALLFGTALWAAASLAHTLRSWLQLDNPLLGGYWAGTTAALVCRASLDASLRKGWYRIVGTFIGAVAIVALTAYFPQSRADFS
ncbi:MAG: FUSC family protein, partial [Bradyrhizobium sp.]|nr:FUSC family protein [Bradyrhizobium sp.]